MYIWGAVLFTIGTAAFFPSMGMFWWKVGTVFFVLGSVLFTSGALLDYFRLERSHFEVTQDMVSSPVATRELNEEEENLSPAVHASA